MKKSRIIRVGLAALAATALFAAQGQPKAPKSKGEQEALRAVMQAPDLDSQIKAAEEVLAKYADTDFKADLLFTIADAYQRKGDNVKMQVHLERTLEADPNHFQAMLLLANAIAQKTREFDLDKEEKLSAAEKHAKKAMELIPNAPKPAPNVPDEQWELEKKASLAQAYQALGLVAMVRKDFSGAISQFEKGVEASPSDPRTMVFLGVASSKAAKYDEAIAAFDKVMNMADAPTQFKQYAQAERARAMQLKAAASKGTSATPAQPAVPQPAETKQP